MKHFILGLFWLLVLPLPAQIRISELSDRDGLKEEHISCLTQDKRGCIWMGTFGGLCSYDGYRSVCYKSMPGDNSQLASNRIQNIACNSDNNIWCMAYDKLFLFDTRTHQFIDVHRRIEESMGKHVEIISVIPLKKKATWVIDKSGNAFRIDDGNAEQPITQMREDETRGKIRKIFEDSRGEEWIVAERQLFMYGKQQVRLNSSIKLWAENGRGIWFATADGKLFFYSFVSNTFSSYTMPLRSGKIRQLLTLTGDSLGVIAEKEVRIFSPAGDSKSILIQKRKDEIFLNGSQDSERCLWSIANTGKVYRYDFRNDNVNELALTDALTPAVTDFSHVLLIENRYGEIWFSLRQWGDLVYWNRTLNTICRPSQTYHTKNIRGRFLDNQQNLWIRKPRGIDKISFCGIQEHWNINTDGKEVRCISEDKDGFVWMADKGGYIRKYDSQRNLLGYLGADGKFTTQKKAFGKIIYAMLQDREGIFWFGTRYNGLYRWNPATGDLRNYRHDGKDIYSLSDDAVFSIVQDEQDRIWIGTLRGGLNLLQDTGNGCRFMNSGNGLFRKNDYHPRCVRSLLEIREQHVLLMATLNGLFVLSTRFDQPADLPLYQNMRRPSDPQSISNNEVLALMRTKKGDIYATTNSGGINRLLSENLLSDTIRFAFFTEANGAYSDLVFSIVEDRSGCLWTVSERVISLFDPQQGTFLNFGNRFLRPDVIFSEAVPYCFEDGMLAFGTEDGLLAIFPENMHRSTIVPPIVFTKLLIQGQAVKQAVDADKGLTLMPEERTITLGFAALDYNQIQPIRYRYRLKGLDEHWVGIDESRSASYVNLPPGNYLFEVESTNGEGTWVDNTRTLSIKVIPTFWETSWAWLVYFFLFLVILSFSLYLYRRFYSLKLRVRAAQELTDAKLRFFTDISHELRTPLTLIDAPVSDILEQDHTLSSQSRVYLEMVQRNANRMLHLVNEILDFRKMQNHKMKLLLQETDIREMLFSLMEYFRPVAEQHHISFLLESPDSVPLLWIDRDKFEKIYFNLLSNAFKYTPDGKRITIFLSVEDEWVRIGVCDEGVGIPENQVNVLFKRFETILKSNLFKASSGIGLSLVKQFADLHQARVQVESRLGAGSTFSLQFSTSRAIYESCPYAEFVDEGALMSEHKYGDDLPEAWHSMKILIVEDNAELRLFLRNILQRQYQVFEAENGKKGLEAIRQYLPDLILSDVMMPEMDGFEMVRFLKTDEDICHIPVILLTAKTLMADQIEGIRIGADDYILKPFNSEYLLARIVGLIRQRQQLQQRYMKSLPETTDSIEVEPQAERTLTGLTSADEVFAQKVMTFVEKHLEDSELTVEQLSNEVGMGRTVFFNKIKSIMGCSPVEFILSVRIRHAVRMFDAGERVISEVAYHTGFNDPKYFSRCFKKQMGVTPTEYLKKHTV